MKIKINISENKRSILLMRLLAAWLLVSSVHLIVINLVFHVSFEENAYYNSIRFLGFLLLVAAAAFLLGLVKDQMRLQFVLVASGMLYAVSAAAAESDVYVAFGCCASVALLLCYCNIEQAEIKLGRKGLWTFAVILMILFTFLVGVTGCLHYLNYWTPCYDFGIFSQMFHYMKETGLPLVTCERDGLLSHFAVHVSPIYYLLLPIFWLIPSPCTLLVMQALVVASGAVPLILICRQHRLSNLAAMLFAAVYLFYPSMNGGCSYYLHENCFLAPLLLWLFYFGEKEGEREICPDAVWMFVFGILTLCVKEDAAMYVAVISLYFFFTKRRAKCNFVMFGISVIYFVMIVSWLSSYGDGAMTGRYENYIYDGSGSLFTMIKAVIQNPIYVVRECFRQEKLMFILQMLVPLAFLPLCGRKPVRLFLLIPFLLMNLMTDYVYQYDVTFQYCFGSGAILFYLSVINYADMGEKRKKMLLISSLSSFIIFIGMFTPRLQYYYNYENAADRRQIIGEALELIPEDASVAAGTFYLTNLWDRDELYDLDRTTQECEYYVLDLRYSHTEYNLEQFQNDTYEELYLEEGIIGIFRKKEASQ